METKSIPVFSKDDFTPSGVVEGHEYVDLGLPSGLKWATCNIGASSPEGYGDYFSWGETNPKDSYEMDSYRFAELGNSDEDCEDSDDEEDDEEPDYYYMVSYNGDDGLKKLNSEDDAAVAKWNGTWRMPSMEDFRELIDNCEWTWGEYNGIAGVKVKGPNGSSIFLPAAGHMDERWEEEEKECCEYWSSCLDDEWYEFDDYLDYFCAQTLCFDKNGSEPACWHRFRELGDPVRPVCIIK